MSTDDKTMDVPADNNSIDTLKLKIKRYLELDNVSVLSGAGTSFHIGAPIIRTVPEGLVKSCGGAIEKYCKLSRSFYRRRVERV